MKRYLIEIIFVLFFILTRLPSLGHDNFNTDVWKWRARTYNFAQGIFTADFKLTLQKYHPGVTLMWLGTVGVKLYNLYYDIVYKHPPLNDAVNTIFELDFIQKLLVVIAIGIGLIFSMYVLRKTFGLDYSLLAMLFLVSEPFYIGLTRVFHLEGLMSTFMLASVLWLFYYLNDRSSESRLVVSAVFAGFSLLTKTASLYLMPFAALVIFLNSIYINKKFNPAFFRFILNDFLKWLTVLGLTFFILWPALWVNAKEVFSDLYRGVAEIGIEDEHIQFYFGKLVTDPGPLYYLVVLGLRASPYLILGLLGLVATFKSSLNKTKFKFMIFLLLYSVFYIIEVTIPSKKLDRYILPSLMSLSLISTFSYYWLFEKIKIHKSIKYLVIIFILAIIPYTVHPDYFSYYSPLFGGLKQGIWIIEPKWMIGSREIVAFFDRIKIEGNYVDLPNGYSLDKYIHDKNPPRVLSIGFQEKYYTQVFPFILERRELASIEAQTPFAKRMEYFVYPVWDDASTGEDRFKLIFIGDIKVRNVPVYKVYKRV